MEILRQRRITVKKANSEASSRCILSSGHDLQGLEVPTLSVFQVHTSGLGIGPGREGAGKCVSVGVLRAGYVSVSCSREGLMGEKTAAPLCSLDTFKEAYASCCPSTL